MTDRLERLINLVIALRETRVPLRAAEIRERVAGYGQPDAEAFRRMFERDKADLRNLGVPVETAAVDVWGDQAGYRIDPRSYDLPPLSLEPEELTALALAVDVTGLADAAGEGLRKLEVDAGRPGLQTPRGAARVDLGPDVPHRETLVAAQVSRTTVRFRYRPARGEIARRTVDPYALVHRRSHWYVVGHDHDRVARRAFRLDRIQGAVTTVGDPGAFEPPAQPIDVSAVIPDSGTTRETAEVAASPEVAWQLARRAQGEGRPWTDGPGALAGTWTVFTLPVVERESFCEWIRDLGPDVELLAPADLRQRLVDSLRDLLAAVGTETSGGAA